ncbi:MAG: FtsH protease activity modulator HflK [Saccharofermentanales bacterium]
MLTADENLVIADWAVMYKVVDSYKWLFNVDSPEKTIRTITEAAYRRVVASHSLDDILTNQKDSIQIEIRESLQGICDKYDFGIQITAVQLQDALPPDPVKDAFLEVASAREDKNAKINEATKYENEKLPIARGEAEQILNLAEGYKQQRINEAEGDTSRFLAIQKEYAANTEVTKTRLYLEMIKAVLPQVKEVYIMSDDGDVLKFLPISDGNRQGAE